MKNKTSAFTLIELILVIVIAGIALPPLVALLVRTMIDSSKVMPFVRPNTLAIELMEEIKGKRWDEKWIGGPLDDAKKTPPASLGKDAGETTRADFDDMDDYKSIDPVPKDVQGNVLSQYAGYTVAVSVYYVKGIGNTLPLNSGTFNFTAAETGNPPTSNHKRIDVAISKGSEITRVSTIVCNY